MARKRYLIIGDGAAGMTAAQTLRARDANARIAIVSDDPHPGYFRAALTNYLLGELREDQLWAVPPDFYQSARISRVFCRVVAIETQNSQVWEASGSNPIPYDALLLASGARPRAADFHGAHLRGIHTMRTIVDVRAITELLAYQSVKAAVVLGGGPLGLEWAHGLHERGVKVHLLERAPRLMNNILDDVCSDLLAARLRAGGIEVHLGERVVQAYPNQQGGVGVVSTESGKAIPCDLVAVAFGVEPNSDFLHQSGIAVDDRRRVCTDRSMKTSVPNVWAAGDVAVVDGESFGLWEPAKRQAAVAANNMCGGRETFSMTPHYLATRLFDLDFASVGEVRVGSDVEVLVDFPQGTGNISYRKLLLRQGRLVGAQMLGQRATRVRRAGRALGRLIKSGADVSSIQGKLLTEEFDVDGWLQTQKLFERPAPEPRQRRLVNLAKLKGTQALDLGSLAHTKAPPAAPHEGTKVLRSRGTRLLSIGLQAEAAPLARELPPLDARLEYQGNQWPVTGAVTRIGSAETAEYRLPNVSQLHAEVKRHGRRMYIRDAGSRSGTRVNGQLITVPHALVDGDQIQIENHLIVFRSTELFRVEKAAQLATNTLGLTVLSGKSLGLAFGLGQTQVTIGSGHHCQLQLTDPSVGTEHARITPHQGQHYLADLGSPSGTRSGGTFLTPHQNILLASNMTFSVGSVDIRYGYQQQATTMLFESLARLIVDRGPGQGQSVGLTTRCMVGSAPDCDLVLAGLMPRHLEIQRQGLDFYVRDVTGQSRSFRSGAPLGAQFVPLNSGDLLLLNGEVMLRFEEDM